MRFNRNNLRYKVNTYIGKVLTSKKSPKIVFVIGSGRCGSTLLMEVLSSNNSIHIVPGELNEVFHKEIYPYKEEYKKVVPPIIQDIKTFTKYSLTTWEQKKQDLINLLKVESAIAGGKTVVVKSAMISLMVKEIAQAFPNAVFIHLYRHGIPVVNSIVTKEFKKYETLDISKEELGVFAAKYWSDCLISIHLDSKKVDNTLYDISYEEIVENPKASLKKICNWIETPSNFSFDFSTISNRNKENILAEGLPTIAINDRLYKGLKYYNYV